MQANFACTRSELNPDLHVKVLSALFLCTQIQTRLQVQSAHFILAGSVDTVVTVFVIVTLVLIACDQLSPSNSLSASDLLSSTCSLDRDWILVHSRGYLLGITVATMQGEKTV